MQKTRYEKGKRREFIGQINIFFNTILLTAL